MPPQNLFLFLFFQPHGHAHSSGPSVGLGGLLKGFAIGGGAVTCIMSLYAGGGGMPGGGMPGGGMAGGGMPGGGMA